ncbi:ABC transporter substrate-binding protein, partial [Roseomonas sp. 18066]|uniref:ABC transporter substrate-binding protein n=1 Tax=Roseomonas sp. 18066 TaxID=2681412 RepID=UPI001F399DCE
RGAGGVMVLLLATCFAIVAETRPGWSRNAANTFLDKTATRPAQPDGLAAGLAAGPAAGLMAAEAAPASVLARPLLATIQARGLLRVCIWPEYYAISYRNPRNRALEGFDIDMARALAERLQVRPEFIDTSFARFVEALEEEACDIAMFGVGVTPERAARVAFSEAYLRGRVYGVVDRGNQGLQRWQAVDQPGVVVAVAAGTLMEPMMRQRLRAATLSVVRPPQTREAEVQAGRADIFISDYPYTRRLLRGQDLFRVIEMPEDFGVTRYAYAMRPGEPALLAEVNRFLQEARTDGLLEQAARRHDLLPMLEP